MRQCRAVSGLLASVAVVVATCVAARAELVVEKWRSPLGLPRAAAVASDGTIWAATGSSLMHLAPDGTALAQRDGFASPEALDVNRHDGSIWVADTEHDQLVHLSPEGAELWRGGGFVHPRSISVNAADGSAWVANAGQNVGGAGDERSGGSVVHLAEDGAELWRWDGLYSPFAVAANEQDGSVWVTAGTENFVVHLDGQGRELFRRTDLWYAGAVAVNQTDGSVWVADLINERMLHLAADGHELMRFTSSGSVAVNPTDGSVWVTYHQEHRVSHFTEDGTELWRSENFGYPDALAANPQDGSCWVGDWYTGTLSHFGSDGTLLRGLANFVAPSMLSLDTRDGSCWVGDEGDNTVVHLTAEGTDLCRESIFGLGWPQAVSVDSSDGTCWVIANWGSDLVRLAADGSELWRRTGYPGLTGIAANPSDGSAWACSFEAWSVLHLASDGSSLWYRADLPYPSGPTVNPTDGSCWVATPGAVVHFAADGTVLQLVKAEVPSVAVNPTDGSWWVADNVSVAHMSAGGAELARLGGQLFLDHALAVDPIDGSCWVAGVRGAGTQGWAGTAIHLAADAAVLWQRDDFGGLADVAVDPRDGSCWVADAADGQVIHLVPLPFSDVPLTHWAYGEIQACARAGIVTGYWDGSYHPEEPVTRAQMAVYLARALVGGDGSVPTGPATSTFTDLDQGHWAFRYIQYCADHGLVVGYWDGTYRPDEVVDRGQMAVYIARAVAAISGALSLDDFVPPASPTFPDVTPGNDWAWCHQYVEYCAAEGIITGYSDGAYHPERTVTRDQMAVYVTRAFGLGGPRR